MLPSHYLRKTTIAFTAASLFFAAGAQATVDAGTSITSAELMSANYSFPGDLVIGATEIQKANYAWRLFIAANNLTSATLKDGSTREIPTQSFITTGSKPLLPNPTVFESFYHRTESYPYYTAGNVPPLAIGKPPVYRFQPTGSAGSGFTVSNGQYVNLDENNEIGQNFLYYRLSNAPDFPVLFMAKVNSTEAQFAYNRQAPSSQSSWKFPDGVIEVKAAWRRVSDIKNSDPNKYHQAMATYYVGTEGNVPTVKTDKFALIALHVIQKTPNYPQFIFTTFEHVDAVTRNASGTIIDPAYQLTSQTLQYGPNDPKVATPLGAYTANQPGLPPASNAVASYTLPAAGPLNQGYITVVQPKTITSETDSVNNQVYGLIKALSPNSVWANYRLKGVQTVPTSDETAPNFYLANIVVESSQPGIQLFRGNISGAGRTNFCNFRQYTPFVHSNQQGAGCVQTTEQPASNANNLTTAPLTLYQPVPTANINRGGCQGCHGVAQTALGGDFSFLVTAAHGSGEAVDVVPAASLSAKSSQPAAKQKPGSKMNR